MRLLLLFVLISACTLSRSQELPDPQTYVCHQTHETIVIDGLANEEAWKAARWTNLFQDIEGPRKPAPYFDTRVKMLWDSNYFYFYAEMEEPHIWAKLTQRDAVIFHDNDFEVFIDPDGDTHNYYELEVNALNTVWDLLLTQPYRDRGQAVDHWDIHGLKTAVNLKGTINDPRDTDEGWAVEIAIPWDALKEAARVKTPPANGDQWRVNFSRVQWETEVVNGVYVKQKNPNTGKNLPENNWTWSAQRAIAMHEPEFWGIVQFSAETPRESEKPATFDRRATDIRKFLYIVHRAQVRYFRKKKSYATALEDLETDAALPRLGMVKTKLSATGMSYLLTITDETNDKVYTVNETGLSRTLKK